MIVIYYYLTHLSWLTNTQLTFSSSNCETQIFISIPIYIHMPSHLSYSTPLTLARSMPIGESWSKLSRIFCNTRYLHEPPWKAIKSDMILLGFGQISCASLERVSCAWTHPPPGKLKLIKIIKNCLGHPSHQTQQTKIYLASPLVKNFWIRVWIWLGRIM